MNKEKIKNKNQHESFFLSLDPFLDMINMIASRNLRGIDLSNEADNKSRDT